MSNHAEPNQTCQTDTAILQDAEKKSYSFGDFSRGLISKGKQVVGGKQIIGGGSIFGNFSQRGFFPSRYSASNNELKRMQSNQHVVDEARSFTTIQNDDVNREDISSSIIHKAVASLNNNIEKDSESGTKGETIQSNTVPNLLILENETLMNIFVFLDVMEILNTAQVNRFMYNMVDAIFGESAASPRALLSG